MDFTAAGHDKGDAQCIACNHAPGYPQPHQCGGLLHADATEDEDGAAVQTVTLRADGRHDVADHVTLYCDTCGATAPHVLPARARGERAQPRTTVPTVLDGDDVPPPQGKGTR